MRLWSLHPRYLDPQGLVALWREALLAQAVLRGETKGYRHHPQLDRFYAQASPTSAIASYLREVHAEATRRGYAFDGSKIKPGRIERQLDHAKRTKRDRSSRRSTLPGTIAVRSGQVAYEWRHLLAKLAVRNPAIHKKWRTLAKPQCHPLFKRRAGGVVSWERHAAP